ncbi:gamma-glutamylcyclotransferase [Streptomyces sp. AJS327]|uniref:gamma-glutamylcyclotransferase family protein n=1 Tax=Streptomyces sp. AJS327 TaxID=2545265 RepID=UPI0015DF5E01|nr:gamma-glutamylcyclotransferase family protein [Streptomyces sp. AJS327]MBA0049921.1 gamma-glutamylcyclotransferase [Streptomyces sp. AJS327]
MADEFPDIPRAHHAPHAGHRLAVAPDTLFVYGTLLFPRILRALLGRAPARRPATAPGWRAAALRDRPYPGLVPAAGTVRGRLLTGLTPAEWRLLDDFEDDDYELRRLHLGEGGYGWAYVWTSEREVLVEDWEPGTFAAYQLEAYAVRLET